MSSDKSSRLSCWSTMDSMSPNKSSRSQEAFDGLRSQRALLKAPDRKKFLIDQGVNEL